MEIIQSTDQNYKGITNALFTMMHFKSTRFIRAFFFAGNGTKVLYPNNIFEMLFLFLQGMLFK